MATIAQHIPDKGAQMVRYYGVYSNKMRGCARKRGTGTPGVAWPKSTPPPPARLPARKWRDLILQAWHSDTLLCPKCQKPMRLIAVIDQPEVVEKILWHLDPWCGPALSAPARPPPGTSPSVLSEPDPDYLAGSNPMPDYENVITD